MFGVVVCNRSESTVFSVLSGRAGSSCFPKLLNRLSDWKLGSCAPLVLSSRKTTNVIAQAAMSRYRVFLRTMVEGEISRKSSYSRTFVWVYSWQGILRFGDAAPFRSTYFVECSANFESSLGITKINIFRILKILWAPCIWHRVPANPATDVA